MIPALLLTFALQGAPRGRPFPVPAAVTQWACRMSPYFCPGAYPRELEPYRRDTHVVPPRRAR